MVSGTGTLNTLDAAAVLTAARRARAAANAAEAEVLAYAVQWAHLHVVEDLDDAATWWSRSGGDTGIPIAGEGCPLISEFAIPELATALGMTQGSGRNLIAQALELAHRLPRVWARVQDGTLAPWRARRIAEETLHLSVEAAAFVDAQVAPFAHKTGIAQTQRLVDEAIARFMPEHAAELRERAADQRHFDIDTGQVSFAGTARVHGELDLADALDLEDAIAAGAQQLAALGSTDSLEVRRAAAAGILARRQLALDLEPETTGETRRGSTAANGAAPTPSDLPENKFGSAGRFGRRRDLVLYVHLTDQTLQAGNPNAPVRVDNAGGQLLTAGQVAEWCGRPETDRITVKPVLDLSANLHCDSYTPSTALAEQVRVRDRHCVFPHCTRPARSCDLDHIIAWDHGGKTESTNLACLCRLHHRLKTHGGWSYQMLEPGTFLWRSPYGYRYWRDPTGTEDVNPKPASPPRESTTDPPDQ